MTLSITLGKQEIARKVGALANLERLSWIALGFGVLVRLVQYASNRSLWVDEAALSLNIVNRSYAELLEPLDFATGAPFAFLMLQKLSVELLGNSEYAVRLVPLLAGIASLFLLYSVAKHYLSPRAVPIVLALFALSTPLIRYATEGKQYSTDLFAGMLILFVSMHVLRRGLSISWLALYAITGAAVVWLSHPSVFVLAGLGAVIGLNCIAKRDWTKAFQLSAVCLIWLVSFGISYQATTAESLVSNTGLIEEFEEQSRFFPLPPRSLSEAQWYITGLFDVFDNPVGLTLTGVAAFAFLAGVVSLVTTSRFTLLLLASPIVVTVLVSGLKLYPFAERWILFLVPFILVFVAEGAAYVIDKTRSAYPVIGFGLLGLLLLYPIASETFHLVEPLGTGEIRPVMNHISANREEGDAIYVYRGARKPFWFYADRFGFEEGEYIIGDETAMFKWDRLESYIAQLDSLRGNDRVWVLFSSVNQNRGINDEEYLTHYLDGIGTRTETFRVKNAVVYLYDLSASSAIAVSGAR